MQGGTSPLFACASSDGRPTQVLPRPPTAGLVRARPPSAVRAPDRPVQVWLPPGRGALVRPSGTGGTLYLVAEGAAYRIASLSALSALGSQTEQVRPLPRGWLAALPKGPALRILRAPGSPGG